jgi:hypothetical protein
MAPSSAFGDSSQGGKSSRIGMSIGQSVKALVIGNSKSMIPIKEKEEESTNRSSFKQSRTSSAQTMSRPVSSQRRLIKPVANNKISVANLDIIKEKAYDSANPYNISTTKIP